ncbi:MAG: hypothetical protein ACREDP_25575, partial [Bradyrhizobium sp.]
PDTALGALFISLLQSLLRSYIGGYREAIRLIAPRAVRRSPVGWNRCAVTPHPHSRLFAD